MKIKTAALLLAACGAAAAGLVIAPELAYQSVPTARLVEVEKVEYAPAVTLSGTVMKNIVRDEAYVLTYVPEQDISKVRTGQSAEITGDAFPGIVYSGTVDYIADSAGKVTVGNVQKTAVEVKILIDEPDGTLKQGYTASVRLITSEPTEMTVVPYEAVDQDDGGEFVYILKEGKAEKLYIDTGAELSEGIELLTAVPENARIITVDELPEDGGAVRLSEGES